MAGRQRLTRLWNRAFYGALIRVQRGWLYRRVAAHVHPPFVISEAGPNDMRAVASWLGAPDMGDPARQSELARNYVATSLGRAIGFAQLVNYGENGTPYTGFWLCSLRVRVGWRGLGVGEALARRRMEDARNMGAQRISLIVYADNTPAVQLDLKLGFERVRSELDAHLEREAATSGRHRIVMSRSL